MMKKKLISVKGKISQEKLIAGLFIIMVFLPVLVKNKTIINTITIIEIYILLASSLNVINGYSNQFSVGQAAFYCVGAYTAGLLSTGAGMSFWIILPLSGIVAAVYSLFLSIPTAKLRGNYFTIVTLGMCEVTRLLCVNWKSLTRGPKGISGIPSPELFGLKYPRNLFFYYLLLLLCAVMLLLTQRVLQSRIGRAWLAIRENQDAASSLGVNARKYKMLNLAYSAFWAGIAGCVYAFFQRYIEPGIFSVDESFNIMTMNVVGGQGTLLGPIIGAITIKTITEFFRFALQYRMLIYSALIILMMWIRPQGLVGSKNLTAGSQKAKTGNNEPKGEADE